MQIHLNSEDLNTILMPTVFHGINIVYLDSENTSDSKIKYTNMWAVRDLNSAVVFHVKESLIEKIAYLNYNYSAVRRTDGYLAILNTMLLNYHSVNYFGPILYADVKYTGLKTNKILVYNLEGLNDTMLLINPTSLKLLVRKCYSYNNGLYSDFEFVFPESAADYVLGCPLDYPWEES